MNNPLFAGNPQLQEQFRSQLPIFLQQVTFVTLQSSSSSLVFSFPVRLSSWYSVVLSSPKEAKYWNERATDMYLHMLNIFVSSMLDICITFLATGLDFFVWLGLQQFCSRTSRHVPNIWNMTQLFPLYSFYKMKSQSAATWTLTWFHSLPVADAEPGGPLSDDQPPSHASSNADPAGFTDTADRSTRPYAQVTFHRLINTCWLFIYLISTPVFFWVFFL